MLGAALAAGILLGILSRVEERSPGLDVGISSNSAWITTAFVVGLSARSHRHAAALGAATLTTANVAYYTWILQTEPRPHFDGAVEFAGMWLTLGLAGGAAFGIAGRGWAEGPSSARLAAGLALASVFIAEGVGALDGGGPTESIGLALGLAIPLASTRRPTEVAAAVAGTAALLVLAHAGALDPVMPP